MQKGTLKHITNILGKLGIIRVAHLWNTEEET